MNYTKPLHIAFFVSAFLSLLVAIFLEKKDLLYVYPFTFIFIIAMYLTEKKSAANYLFIVALLFALSGGIYLIIGFGQYVPEVSILISLFYSIYIRLMYVKNIKMKSTVRMYFWLFIIFIPVLYICDRVICLIYSEIENSFIYFAIMAILMLIYIIAALYYYLRNKNQSNLWMLITAVNLWIMNIIVTINELYLYERMFTVIAILCSNFFLFFSLKFMLEDDKTDMSATKLG